MRIALQTINFTILCLFTPIFAFAQTSGAEQPKGKFSGNAQLVYNFFQRDTAIGAANNPLYDKHLSGGASWVNLNYIQGSFEAGVRLDAFQNANIHDPTVAYTDQGIGNIYIKKQIDKLGITAGNFYEQFGSGVALRCYEDRALGIDNALFGLRANYQLNDKWTVKAVAGAHRNLFKFFAPTTKGINIEGNISIKDSANGLDIITFAPGASIVNRTLDQTTMNTIVSNINALNLEQRFVPTYNTYIFQAYNTTQYKGVNWYLEYNHKTHEAINDQDGNLIDKDGRVVFTTLGYSRKGFGINAQYKRTENFVLRTSPNERLLRGMVSFLPPTTRQNSLRLPARYTAAAQELSEQSYQIDMIISPTDHLSFNTNFSNMTDITGKKEFFREFYQDVTINKDKNEWVAGLQIIDYNIDFFQQKPNASTVRTFTPFVEYTRRFDRKRSLRCELQYMATDRDKQLFPFLLKDASRPKEKQDFGDWTFALIEYNIAPHWSFAVSDMYNVHPTRGEARHYPNVFMSYTEKTTRFTVAYAKQVEGVVCTGGVCRFEPAFSGVRVGMTTSW